CDACSVAAGAQLDGTCALLCDGACAGNPDGNPCDDGDACTLGDICQQGVCTGALRGCPWLDACHPGKCDPNTGLCSNPLDPNCGGGGANLPADAGAQACSTGDDCPGDHPYCVDQVCCDKQVCDGCYSCALPDHPGTCTAELGVDLHPACGTPVDCL